MLDALLVGTDRSTATLQNPALSVAEAGDTSEILEPENEGSAEVAATCSPEVSEPVAEETPLAAVRTLATSVRSLSRAAGREERTQILEQMQAEARSLRSAFSTRDFAALTTFSAALGRLFTTLSHDPEKINPSALRTISHAIDFLSQFLAPGSEGRQIDRAPLRILVVDDDEICRRTLLLALRNPDMELTSCENAAKALAYLRGGAFDVVFTDIMMPGGDGFSLAAELRKLPNHLTTPIIFVTALSDFVTRSRSIISGGCDLIAKPFTVGEIVLKALTFGLKHRISSLAAKPPGEAPADRPAQENNSETGEAPMPEHALEAPENAPNVPPSRRDLSPLNGVICLDELGAIKSMNQDCAAILGYAPGEVMDWSITRLLPDELQSGQNATTMGQMLAGEFKTKRGVEMIGRRRDSSTVRMLVTISQTEADGRRQFVSLLRWVADLTATQTPLPCPDAEETQPSHAPVRMAAPPSMEPPARGNDEETSRPRHRNAHLVGTPGKRCESPGLPESGPQTSLISAALSSPRPVEEPLPVEPSPILPPHHQMQHLREVQEQLRELQEELSSKQALMRQEQALRLEIERQLHEITARHTELEARLQEHSTHAAELNRQKEHWEACSRERAERLAEVTGELEKQIARRKEIEERAAVLGAEQHQLSKLEQEHNLTAAKLQTHLEAEAGLKRASERLQQQVEAQKAELERLNAALRAEESARRDAESAAAALATVKARLENDLAQYARKSGNWERDQQALQDLLRGETELRERVSVQLAEAVQLKERAEAKSVELARQKDLAERRAAERARAPEGTGSELANPAQTDESLRQKIGELEAAHQAMAAKLSTARSQLVGEISQRQRLESKVRELERAKTELTRQSEGAGDRDELWQQTIQSLQAELAQSRSLLETELKEQAGRESELKDKCAALELQLASAEESSTQIRAQLSQETARRSLAEQKAEELAGARSSLERDLAQRQQIEEQLRRELQEKDERLRSQLESLCAEQRRLEAKAKELQTAQTALGELTAKHLATSDELASSQQANGSLRKKIEELDAAHQAVAAKLSAARSQIVGETSQRQRLEAKVRELERAKAELTRRSEGAGERDNLRLQTIQSLRAELDQSRTSLETELKEQAARESELKDKCSAFELQLTGLEESLAQTRSQLGQESARRAMAEQKAEELSGARTSLEKEVARRKQSEEQLQRELREKEDRLQARVESLSAEQHKLETKVQELQAAELAGIQNARKERAALRYALLDASRVKAQVSGGYAQAMRQSLDQLRQFASALLNTPLSAGQRQLASSLKTAADDSVRDYAEKARVEKLRIEPFLEQNVVFSVSETISGAFEVIRAQATEAGVEANTEISGGLPEKLAGDGAHLYQLLTLLSYSIFHFAEAERLDVTVSLKATPPNQAEGVLGFLVRSRLKAKHLCARLAEITTASESLDLSEAGEGESGIALGWELAQAMGALPKFESAGENQILIQIALPLQNVPVDASEAS